MFILVGGSLVAVLGLVFALFGLFSGLFVVGLIIGLLTVLVGILMLAVPGAHSYWGVFAIVLALVSIPFALGGLVLGFLLAVVGGWLAIAWKPLSPVMVTVEARTIPPPSG